MQSFLDGRVVLHTGDNMDVLKTFADNSIDSICTDPPYGLQFMGREWDKLWRNETKADKEYVERTSRSRKLPDYSATDQKQMQAWHEAWARECIRVLKPGGYIAAFSSSRTYHRMACAIEDAGFEVRDSLIYCYGTGFPKNHNISKNLDHVRCGCRAHGLAKGKAVAIQSEGDNPMRTVRDRENSPAGLDPERESAHLLQSVMSSEGTCATSDSVCGKREGEIEARKGIGGASKSGMEGRRDLPQETRQLCEREICEMPTNVFSNGESGRVCDGASFDNGEMVPDSDTDRVCSPRGPQSAEQFSKQFDTVAGQPEPQERGAWPLCERCGKPVVPDGLGSALKPAHEPICLARKPFSEKTGAANVLRWGTGALNIGASRVASGGEDLTRECRGMASAENEGWRRPWMENAAKQKFGSTDGRWPANFVHDNSPEVLACFPETTSGANYQRGTRAKGEWLHTKEAGTTQIGHDDTGSAARFFASFPQDDEPSAKRIFYSAKADQDSRLGSKHPTVKPLALMQWLVKLITPPSRLVCPHCDMISHEKDIAKSTSSGSPVRPMRDSIQTKRQSTPGPVLQQAMCERGNDAEAENMRCLQSNIPTDSIRAEVLRPVVCSTVDGEESQDNTRLCDDETRLQASAYAGTSSVTRAGGLHIRAPLADGEENREDVTANGSCPPHQSPEGRQQDREPSIDAQAGSRQAESSSPEQDSVPLLRCNSDDKQTCPHCGHKLESRGGVVLDIFAGTGTTGEAAYREGFKAILIERESEYIKDIERRMSLVMDGKTIRKHAGIKARGKESDAGPLFGGASL